MTFSISSLHVALGTSTAGTQHLEQFTPRGARAQAALQELRARAEPAVPATAARTNDSPASSPRSLDAAVSAAPSEADTRRAGQAIARLERAPLASADIARAAAADDSSYSDTDISEVARVRATALAPAAEAPARLTSAARTEAPDALDAVRLRERTVVREVAFSFDVVTQDGDHVNVSLDLTDSRTYSQLNARTNDGDRYRVQGFERSLERNVNITISGELDEAELAAIDKVSSQVVEIARDFLAHGGRTSLEQAAKLEIDSSELSSFALKLAQSSKRTVQATQFDGAHAAQRLARLDRRFAADLAGLGASLQKLITAPDPAVDTGTKAQLANKLLPHLLDTVPAEGRAEAATPVVETSAAAA